VIEDPPSSLHAIFDLADPFESGPACQHVGIRASNAITLELAALPALIHAGVIIGSIIKRKQAFKAATVHVL
jgi:hypothetical protein